MQSCRKCSASTYISFYLEPVKLHFRIEIENLSQDSETQEIQIKSTNEKLTEEFKNRKKLEKVLQDAAGALRVALRVGVNKF